MRRPDIAVIGIGIVSMAAVVAAQDMTSTPSEEAPVAPAPIETQAPAMSAEQQSEFDSWPADKQAQFLGWSAEAQSYFWSLNPARQELLWMLDAADREVLLSMEPVEREATWTELEGRVAAESAPDKSAEPESPEGSY